jgi:hypothetical protein
MTEKDRRWPALPLEAWEPTRATLHMWTQIVGKIRLALSPYMNHWWQVPLYVTARGLTTSPIPYDEETFEIAFDFIDHNLLIQKSDGAAKMLHLAPRSVAEFYTELMAALRSMDIAVKIWTMPVEIPDPIPFDQDRTHASYDPDYANRFWRILVASDQILKEFRGRFIGKARPVHFFWGSFDLAVTRFSGRRAPRHPGGIAHLPDAITREAYSQEVSSLGFWPGNDQVPTALFYSYAYPSPDGFAEAKVKPADAYFHPQLREFVLPYDKVRRVESPDEAILEFAQSAYDAASSLAKWDRAAFEEKKPVSLSHRDQHS